MTWQRRAALHPGPDSVHTKSYAKSRFKAPDGGLGPQAVSESGRCRRPGGGPGPAPHHGPCLTVARQCPIGSPTDPRARPWSKILQVVADYRGAVLEASVQTMLKIKVESRVGVTLRL